MMGQEAILNALIKDCLHYEALYSEFKMMNWREDDNFFQFKELD